MEPAAHAITVKGIVHCHTNLSYDCTVPLEELCSVLRGRGFSFVALTEHAQGVSSDAYKTFVEQCSRVSDESFVAIPGLECRCDSGIEVVGIGVYELVTAQSPQDVVAEIRQLGGYTVWVHPLKRALWNGALLDCDAVEVLNGKVDGTVVPSLSLLYRVRDELQKGRSFHTIFGWDLHHLEASGEVWVECQVRSLSAQAIVKALRDGHFCNRTRYAAVSCWGQTQPVNRVVLMAVHAAYVAWNWVLARLPEAARSALIWSSRPLARLIKGNSARGEPYRSAGSVQR